MPARLRDIKRVLTEMGISVETPSRGSQWKARNSSGKVYPLPCSNGERTELSDVYLKGLCRTFGLDLDEFKRKL